MLPKNAKKCILKYFVLVPKTTHFILILKKKIMICFLKTNQNKSSNMPYRVHLSMLLSVCVHAVAFFFQDSWKKKAAHLEHAFISFFSAMWSFHDRFTSILGVYDARNTHTSVVNIQQIYVLHYDIIPEIMFVLHNIIIIWQLWMYNSIWESIRNIEQEVITPGPTKTQIVENVWK